jgi:hypothetical protein
LRRLWSFIEKRSRYWVVHKLSERE